MVIHPLAKASEVVHFYRDFTSKAADEVGSAVSLMTSPDGMAVAVLIATYFGPVEEGEKALAPLRHFGPPVADVLQPMPYTALQKHREVPAAGCSEEQIRSHQLLPPQPEHQAGRVILRDRESMT
jgi:hypothetical protein